MEIRASLIPIHRVAIKNLQPQDLFSTMMAATISSNLIYRRKTHLSNSILICKHNNIKRWSIANSSINSLNCIKKLQIKNLSQKLRKMMICSTIFNRLLSKLTLHPRHNRKCSQQWMLNLCFQANQIRKTEVVKPKMPVAISLKTQHSKHRVNSFSNNLKRNPSRRHRLEIIWEVQRCLPLISLISFLSSLKYSNRFPLRYSKKDQYNKLPLSLHKTQFNSL